MQKLYLIFKNCFSYSLFHLFPLYSLNFFIGYVGVFFPYVCDFPHLFLLWLISILIPLWLEKYLVWFQSLNLLTPALSLNILSVLENVPCALEKTVYSAVVEWSVLYMSVLYMSSCFIELFKLLLLADPCSCPGYYLNWSIEVSTYYWKIVFVESSVSSFNYLIFFFIYFKLFGYGYICLWWLHLLDEFTLL